MFAKGYDGSHAITENANQCRVSNVYVYVIVGFLRLIHLQLHRPDTFCYFYIHTRPVHFSKVA